MSLKLIHYHIINAHSTNSTSIVLSRSAFESPITENSSVIFIYKFSCLNSFFLIILTGAGSTFSKEHARCRTLWKLSRDGFKRFYSRSLSLNVSNSKINMFLKFFLWLIEKPSEESLQGVYAPWSEFDFWVRLWVRVGLFFPSWFAFSELVCFSEFTGGVIWIGIGFNRSAEF